MGGYEMELQDGLCAAVFKSKDAAQIRMEGVFIALVNA